MFTPTIEKIIQPNTTKMNVHIIWTVSRNVGNFLPLATTSVNLRFLPSSNKGKNKSMKTFEYTIKDELGIHARPAGMLVKEAKNFASECTITKDGKTKKLTQLMMLMSLGVKQGDTVTVAANGEDEDAAIETLKAFFEANL